MPGPIGPVYCRSIDSAVRIDEVLHAARDAPPPRPTASDLPTRRGRGALIVALVIDRNEGYVSSLAAHSPRGWVEDPDGPQP